MACRQFDERRLFLPPFRRAVSTTKRRPIYRNEETCFTPMMSMCRNRITPHGESEAFLPRDGKDVSEHAHFYNSFGRYTMKSAADAADLICLVRYSDFATTFTSSPLSSDNLIYPIAPGVEATFSSTSSAPSTTVGAFPSPDN